MSWSDDFFIFPGLLPLSRFSRFHSHEEVDYA